MASSLNVAQLMVKVGADTSEATAALGSLGTMLSKAGPIALGGAIVGAAVVGVGVAALKMAGDYQAGLTTLVTGAGEVAGPKGLGLIQNALLNMAVSTGQSTQQLISGLFMIESAGYHGAQGLAVLQAAAEGAKVGNADLMTVGDAVTTVMKDYATSGIDADHATNLLIATVAAGKTHMEDLASSISTVLPAASKFGISLGDVMGAMATMTSHGIAAANAATYLRQMIVSLEAPTSAGAKAMASVGLSAAQVVQDIKEQGLPATLQIITDAIGKTFPAGSTAALTAFKEIAGGSRQMQGMLALTGSSAQEFAKDALSLGGAAYGASKGITGWTAVQGTFNFQLSRAKEAAEVLMIELGQHLIPVATQLMSMLANGLIPTIQNFISFITGTSTAAEILRPILAVAAILIGGALVAAFVAWAVAAGAAAVATIAATWPILAAGAAIALLIAALVWAYNNWGFFHTAVDDARNNLGLIIPTIQIVTTWIGNLFEQIGKLLSALGGIKNAVGGAIGSLGGLANAASSVGSVVGGALSHIPHFATGGTMGTAGLAIVGESGPELVQMPGGAQITPLATAGAGAISGPPSGMSVLPGGASGTANGQPIQVTLYLDKHKLGMATAQALTGALRLGTGVRQ